MLTSYKIPLFLCFDTRKICLTDEIQINDRFLSFEGVVRHYFQRDRAERLNLNCFANATSSG